MDYNLANTQPESSSSTSSGGSKSPNIGAIAGGVVGGVVAVVIISFLAWKFCFKGRRQQYQEEWQEDTPIEKDPDFMANRSARASTHTVASLASTIMTRASNVIQIAYIPGVTNRSGPGSSPGLLVPPVPPIPAMASPSTNPSSPYSIEDQHFFVPGDLRDSTYSGVTSLGDGRSSYARTSITPSLARSSVATTMYRQNAVVPAVPAQTIVRGKAAVVSVKSSQTNSPIESPNATPPVPQVDYARFADAALPKGQIQIRMPTSSDSPGIKRSPIGSVRSTATVGKPVPLNIVKRSPSNASSGATATAAALASGVASASALNPSNSLHSKYSTASSASPRLMRPLTEVSVTLSDSGPGRKSAAISSNNDSDSDSDFDPHERARRSLLQPESQHRLPRESAVTEIADTPAIGASPFADNVNGAGHRDSRTMDMADILMMDPVEERDESRRESYTRDGARGTSPFGDENEVSDVSR